MIKIDLTLQPSDLAGKLKRFWQLSGEKIRLILPPERCFQQREG
jgi:hypothetical protein